MLLECLLTVKSFFPNERNEQGEWGLFYKLKSNLIQLSLFIFYSWGISKES